MVGEIWLELDGFGRLREVGTRMEWESLGEVWLNVGRCRELPWTLKGADSFRKSKNVVAANYLLAREINVRSGIVNACTECC